MNYRSYLCVLFELVRLMSQQIHNDDQFHIFFVTLSMNSKSFFKKSLTLKLVHINGVHLLSLKNAKYHQVIFFLFFTKYHGLLSQSHSKWCSILGPLSQSHSKWMIHDIFLNNKFKLNNVVWIFPYDLYSKLYYCSNIITLKIFEFSTI